MEPVFGFHLPVILYVLTSLGFFGLNLIFKNHTELVLCGCFKTMDPVQNKCVTVPDWKVRTALNLVRKQTCLIFLKKP